MGYSISIVDETGNTVQMSRSFLVRGSNIRVDEHLNPIEQTEAETSITYNYSSYFYEATEGDERFLVRDEETGKDKNGGIRGLYGKTMDAAIPMIVDMISRIRNKYSNQVEGKWLDKEIEIKHYYDQNGIEVNDPLHYILDGKSDLLTVEIEKRIVSEGATADLFHKNTDVDYWTDTAGNAIEALNTLLCMASASITVKNAVFQGD